MRVRYVSSGQSRFEERRDRERRRGSGCSIRGRTRALSFKPLCDSVSDDGRAHERTPPTRVQFSERASEVEFRRRGEPTSLRMPVRVRLSVGPSVRPSPIFPSRTWSERRRTDRPTDRLRRRATGMNPYLAPTDAAAVAAWHAVAPSDGAHGSVSQSRTLCRGAQRFPPTCTAVARFPLSASA